MAKQPQSYRLSDVDPEVREKAWAAIFHALGARTEAAQGPIKREIETAILQYQARKEGPKPPDPGQLSRIWNREVAEAAELLALKLDEDPDFIGVAYNSTLERIFGYSSDPFQNPELEGKKIVEFVKTIADASRNASHKPSKNERLQYRSKLAGLAGKNTARILTSNWKLRDWSAQDLLIDLAKIYKDTTGDEPTRISVEIWREGDPDPEGQTPAGPFLALVSGVCDLAAIDKTDQGVDRMIRWYRDYARKQQWPN